MIPELFLTCALATSPAIAFPKSTLGAAIQMITESALVTAKLLRVNRRLLIVGGDPQWVDVYRTRGLSAFGALTEDRPGATLFHAVADPLNLPFQQHLFQTLVWLDNNATGQTCFAELAHALTLIEPSGFLMFYEDDYPFWHNGLLRLGWLRLPFIVDGLAIWQNTERNDYLLHRKIPFRELKVYRAVLLRSA